MSASKPVDTWTASYYWGGGVGTGVFALGQPWYAAIAVAVGCAVLMALIITFRRWLDRRVAVWKQRLTVTR